MGADHVAPLSAERMSRSRGLGAPILASSVKESTSVPSGSTTIWLLIVWLLAPGVVHVARRFPRRAGVDRPREPRGPVVAGQAVPDGIDVARIRQVGGD
jgi:hypothetical protein